MKTFKSINNVAGWFSFAVAALVYLLTIEPTASLWDCGEFIATSYKMEVGHPPGNSMFMLIARFFTLFAGSPESVAISVNIMSALCSAFCILFLFWSITHLARRVYTQNKPELSTSETVAVIGAGLVGAFAYMFSDTFWFSAVEGEVYAMSSLFTALVFWAMLKWEEEADKKFANRWLVLLAYLMGVSIGVHQLNLLALPALIFIYYFKKYPVTKSGIFKASLVAVAVLLLTVFVLFPGLPSLARWVELMFVNSFGLPYNSGLAVYAFAVLGVLAFLIYWAYKHGKVLLNTIALCLAMFILGYFSLAVVVIRSDANTPINENAPDNAFALLSYLNREQYGNRPLVSGESFASPYQFNPATGAVELDTYTSYFKDSKGGKSHYNSTQSFSNYKYNPDYNMFLPRLYSRQPGHPEMYADWTGMNIPRSQNGRYDAQAEWAGPKMSDNLKYMFRYQFDWMYWRYFMWNFAGRQSDIQGNGNSFNGNWITGIDPIDDMRLGIKSADLPDYIKENKGHNRYFLLPFILGVVGLVFQLYKDKRNFTVVALLFIMTGIAIAFYLNMPPSQPRERDYVFAGSTYAFAIWIGFGVLALYQLFRKYVKGGVVAPVAAITVSMVVPVIMGAQNWDDHDRSNRYVARDFAYNYLNTCGKNAILYTFGDNDTFPLWYLQEVEEQRTDVRVMNVSLLGGDWYIDQMKNKVYDSDPVPFSLAREHYQAGTNDGVFINERTKEALTARQLIDFVANPKYWVNGEAYIPTRTIAVPVDKQAALANGIISAKDSLVVDTLYLRIGQGKQYLTKAELMTIDLFANYKWDRPIYFSAVGGSEIALGLENYWQFEGFANKIVPILTIPVSQFAEGRIDTDVLYDNLMNKYHWGNINEKGVLIDYHVMVQAVVMVNLRTQFTRLAEALLNEGKTEKAVAVLNRCMEVMPRNPFFYNMSMLQNELAVMDIISAYYRANEIDKANKLFDEFVGETNKSIKFFMNMKNEVSRELQLNIAYLHQMEDVANKYGQKERADYVSQLRNGIYQMGQVQ